MLAAKLNASPLMSLISSAIAYSQLVASILAVSHLSEGSIRPYALMLTSVASRMKIRTNELELIYVAMKAA